MATEGKSKFWFWVAVGVLVVLLWRWWKRHHAIVTGANLGPTASFDPDHYAPETIASLNTILYHHPTMGYFRGVHLYDQYIVIRDTEGRGTFLYNDVVAQMERAIRSNFRSAQG